MKLATHRYSGNIKRALGASLKGPVIVYFYPGAVWCQPGGVLSEAVMEETALGNKLFLSLLVRVLIVFNLFPDGSGTNRG